MDEPELIKETEEAMGHSDIEEIVMWILDLIEGEQILFKLNAMKMLVASGPLAMHAGISRAFERKISLIKSTSRNILGDHHRDNK